jgi:hypothetical protein
VVTIVVFILFIGPVYVNGHHEAVVGCQSGLIFVSGCYGGNILPLERVSFSSVSTFTAPLLRAETLALLSPCQGHVCPGGAKVSGASFYLAIHVPILERNEFSNYWN